MAIINTQTVSNTVTVTINPQ